MFAKKSPLTVLKLLNDPRSNIRLEIIFVHGLDGDLDQTWNFDRPLSWKDWLNYEFDNINIWTLGYRLRSSNWFGGSMPLVDRATNVLSTINVEIPGNTPIVFVCHSYGGLLVKQMLRNGRDVSVEFRNICDRTRGIIFLGTPHNGSGISSYIDTARLFTRSSSAISELKSNNSLLRDLSGWFSQNIDSNQIFMRCYFETIETKGIAIVVGPDSANVHIKGVHPIGIDADHIGICKPPFPDVRVKDLISMIKKILGSNSISQNITPMGRVIMADNQSLSSVINDLTIQSMSNPNDANVMRALVHARELRKSTVPDFSPAYRSTNNISTKSSIYLFFLIILSIAVITSVSIGPSRLAEMIKSQIAIIPSLKKYTE